MFFLEPVQLHLELADLLIERRLQRRVVFCLGIRPRREDLRQGLQSLFLPLGDLNRIPCMAALCDTGSVLLVCQSCWSGRLLAHTARRDLRHQSAVQNVSASAPILT